MVVYYVEGDGGHLLTEKVGRQQFRIVVRGTCVSYHMPWADIMDVVPFVNAVADSVGNSCNSNVSSKHVVGMCCCQLAHLLCCCRSVFLLSWM